MARVRAPSAKAMPPSTADRRLGDVHALPDHHSPAHSHTTKRFSEARMLVRKM